MSFENLFIFHFQISVIRYRNKLKQSLNKEAFQRWRKVCEIWGEQAVKKHGTWWNRFCSWIGPNLEGKLPLVPLVPPALQIVLWTVQHSGTNGRTDAAECVQCGGSYIQLDTYVRPGVTYKADPPPFEMD